MSCVLLWLTSSTTTQIRVSPPPHEPDEMIKMEDREERDQGRERSKEQDEEEEER